MFSFRTTAPVRPYHCAETKVPPQWNKISSADEIKMDCRRKKFHLRTKFISSALQIFLKNLAVSAKLHIFAFGMPAHQFLDPCRHPGHIKEACTLYFLVVNLDNSQHQEGLGTNDSCKRKGRYPLSFDAIMPACYSPCCTPRIYVGGVSCILTILFARVSPEPTTREWAHQAHTFLFVPVTHHH